MSKLAGLLLLTILLQASASAQTTHYGMGDFIDPAVVVADKQGSSVSLQSLLAAEPSRVNVVFIFGGGDLGSGSPGHLWCSDSFEDTHILRTLYGNFADKGVNFIAIAEPPAYHSKALGKPAGVFMNEAQGSELLADAHAAFIASTLAAQQDGILPLQPYFDLRFALMLNRVVEALKPGPAYGEPAAWAGAFRAEGETQFYGVPSFWLVDDSGKILAPPFRGNVYHPHGAEVNINYTYNDIASSLTAALKDQL